MSIAHATVLLFLFVVPVAAGDVAPAPELVSLEQELTRKLGEPGLDRASPPYLQFVSGFRKRLDAEIERVPANSVNTGLRAQILARLGSKESKESADTLRAGLKSDPADHTLRCSLAFVEYERKNYSEAAAAAKVLLDPTLNPPPPKEVIEMARALWFKAKDRRAASEKDDRSSEGNSSPSAPKKEPEFHASSPTKRIISEEPPSPSGRTEPAWEAARAGRMTLEKSALGRDILAYAREQGIRFKFADLPPNVGAQFESGDKVISVPRNFANEDPMEAAVLIGHEGFHARQILRDGMKASVEVEQDANFADRVIYHELIDAGVRRLPRGHPREENYRRFVDQVQHQDFSQYNRDIGSLYEKQRVPMLMRAVEKIPTRPMRWLLSSAFSVIDADFLRDFETLDYQETKLWNQTERIGILTTRKEHRAEQAWQLKWMKEHQQYFPPPVWPH